MVALALVIHSPEVGRGLVAMLAAAARGVSVTCAAGTDAGTAGTSAPEAHRALRAALDAAPDGVVVLIDLNSAALALEMALEQLSPAERERVRVSRGPLLEGALAGAIAASGGAGLEAVLAATQAPIGESKLPDDWPADGRAPTPWR
jgi:PTS hybrid protein